jgi:hypothetical protein
MVKIINTTESERKLFSDLERVDGWLSSLRETIRRGDVVRVGDIAGDLVDNAPGEVTAA